MPNSKNASGSGNRSRDTQNEHQKTASDFEQTVRQAESENKTKKPGQSQGNNSKQHNNGRGGGK
jgi:hypothetical protein